MVIYTPCTYHKNEIIWQPTPNNSIYVVLSSTNLVEMSIYNAHDSAVIRMPYQLFIEMAAKIVELHENQTQND
jgi:hypothetical protein